MIVELNHAGTHPLNNLNFGKSLYETLILYPRAFALI